MGINLFDPSIVFVVKLLKETAYLLYPLCCWVAEVYFNNFRMIKWLFIIFSSYHTAPKMSDDVIAATLLLISTAGLGMFESNAIQFGMDQMLNGSFEQLSSLIHRYFWCAHIGPFVLFYTAMGTVVYFENCKSQMDHVVKLSYTIINFFVLIISGIETVIFIFAVIYIYWSKQRYQNNQKSRNSMKIICEVFKFSPKHKIPELRSALTYWENDIPSQIDLGKDKYGGPFTYEEIENIEIFFRLLLLILSLFGFQLSGDGYSLTQYVMTKAGCPSIIPY